MFKFILTWEVKGHSLRTLSAGSLPSSISTSYAKWKSAQVDFAFENVRSVLDFSKQPQAVTNACLYVCVNVYNT